MVLGELHTRKYRDAHNIQSAPKKHSKLKTTKSTTNSDSYSFDKQNRTKHQTTFYNSGVEGDMHTTHTRMHMNKTRQGWLKLNIDVAVHKDTCKMGFSFVLINACGSSLRQKVYHDVEFSTPTKLKLSLFVKL